MSVRRDGRVAAVQVLYGLDVGGTFEVVEQAIARHFAHLAPDAAAELQAFAAKICRGVVEHRAAIDALIARSADNWRLERMSCVDRNVLRVALYELEHCPDVPARVVLNEAIEVAKQLGATESGAFVNGVLGRALKDHAG